MEDPGCLEQVSKDSVHTREERDKERKFVILS